MYTLVCVLWIKRGVKIFLDPFPSVAAQRGTRRPIIRCQAVLSLLSESEKVQREGFFFRRCIPQVLNRQCENKLFSGFLDEDNWSSFRLIWRKHQSFFQVWRGVGESLSGLQYYIYCTDIDQIRGECRTVFSLFNSAYRKSNQSCQLLQKV